MAFRKRRMFRRRAPIRRRRVFRRRRIHRPIGAGDLGKRFMKLTNVVTANTTTTVFVNYYFDNEPSVSADWSPLTALFDYYKVNAMSVTFIPHFDTTFNLQTTTPSVTAQFNPVYMFADDNHPSPSGVPPLSVITGYENMRVKSANRKCVYYRKYRNRTIAIDNQNVDVIDLRGYRRTSDPQASAYINFFFASAPNPSTSFQFGTFIIRYYCTFKNRI